METAYKLRAFAPCHEEDLTISAALMGKVWGATDFSTEDYNRWQYVNNPYGEGVGEFVDFKQNSSDPISQSVAQYMTVGSTLFNPQKNSDTRCLLSANTATDPDHQRKGLFKLAALETYSRAAQLGYECVYGFPNESSRPGFLKMGFIELEPLQLYFSIKRVLPFVGQAVELVRSWGFPNLEPVDYATLPRELFKTVSREVPEFIPPDVTEKKQFLHVARSKQWLNWRYKSHPTRDYLYLSSTESILVLKLMKLKSLHICMVMDVMGVVGEKELESLAEFLRVTKCALVCGVFSPALKTLHPKLSSIFWQVPIKLAPKNFYVIYKNLTSGSSGPNYPSFFTLGDIDLY